MTKNKKDLSDIKKEVVETKEVVKKEVVETKEVDHDLEFCKLQIKKSTQRIWELRALKKNGKDVGKQLTKTLKELHESRALKKRIIKKEW